MSGARGVLAAPAMMTPTRSSVVGVIAGCAVTDTTPVELVRTAVIVPSVRPAAKVDEPAGPVSS